MFTKENAKKYGSMGGRAATHKKSEKTLLKEKAEKERLLALEEAAYNEFVNAESGIFNGFRMVNKFHGAVKKADAIRVAYADDCATACGVNVGMDGVACYFYAEPENVTKQVRFNHSVYLF